MTAPKLVQHDLHCERVTKKQTWCTCERRAKEHRDHRIVIWTQAGLDTEEPDGQETTRWEEQVWWGYWHDVENSEPPDALFPSEEEAMAYAKLVGKAHDFCVQPCVLQIDNRDSFEVPE